MKNTLFAVLAAFLSISSASAERTYTQLSYELDGLDLWALPAGTNANAAIKAFIDKCDGIPTTRIQPRLNTLKVDATQFKFNTEVYSVRIRDAGTSYRCKLSVQAAPGANIRFSEWQVSQSFYDVVDSTTGTILKTATDQCIEHSKLLDSKTAELNLFDRYSLVEWVGELGSMQLTRCFVKYIQLVR